METITVSPELFERSNGVRDIHNIRRSVGSRPVRRVRGINRRTKKPVYDKPQRLENDRVIQKITRPTDRAKRILAKKVVKNSVKAQKVIAKKENMVPVISPEKKQEILKQGGDVKKTLKKVTNKSPEHVAVKLSFEVLKPLKPVFETALEYMGVKPSKDMPVLVEQTYNNIVRKSPKTGVANFEIDYPYINLANVHSDSVEVAKDTVVNAIIDFVKNVNTKAAAGEPLTKIEQIIVDGTQMVKTNLTNAAKEEAAQQVGQSILFDGNTQLIIGGVILGVILLVFIIARS